MNSNYRDDSKLTVILCPRDEWTNQETHLIVTSLNATLSRYFQKPDVLILDGDFSVEQIKKILPQKNFLLRASTVLNAHKLPFYPSFLR